MNSASPFILGYVGMVPNPVVELMNRGQSIRKILTVTLSSTQQSSSFRHVHVYLYTYNT